MAFGKDTCSSCGKYADIRAKVLNEGETLYCKECHDKELKIMLENFNQIKFYCIKCGSSNLTKNDPKTDFIVKAEGSDYTNAKEVSIEEMIGGINNLSKALENIPNVDIEVAVDENGTSHIVNKTLIYENGTKEIVNKK